MIFITELLKTNINYTQSQSAPPHNEEFLVRASSVDLWSLTHNTRQYSANYAGYENI